MNWPSTFKRSDKHNPASFLVAWTSENFDIIVSFCMNYSTSMEDRKATLLLTNGQCSRVDCREPLWYMLYAMYLQQSRDEQQTGVTIHSNGIGFNRFDDKFLSGIAARNYSAGQLSHKETYHVAKCLKKYKRQILSLATPVKTEPEQLEFPLANSTTYSV